jgi:hypothetical protein
MRAATRRARKATTMVAASQIDVGAAPTRCLIDGLLMDAVGCLDRDDAVGAGARVRHATLLLLTSLALHVGIRRPFRSRFPKPARIARALFRAKRVDLPTLESLLELLATCNAAVHCNDVGPAPLRDGVQLLRSIADGGHQQ